MLFTHSLPDHRLHSFNSTSSRGCCSVPSPSNLWQWPQLILFAPMSVPSILSGSCEISYNNSLNANHRNQPQLNV